MTEATRRTFLATGSAAILSAQSPSETIRVAFIGVGNRGSFLLKHMLNVPGVQVVAISDLNPERLKAALAAVAAKGGTAQAYPEFRKMLDRKDIDAVVIATPVNLHKEMVLAALEVGKHVYSEKPMGFEPEQCRQIVAAAKSAKGIYQAGFQLRHDPNRNAAMKYIQAGGIGKVVFLQGYRHSGDLPHVPSLRMRHAHPACLAFATVLLGASCATAQQGARTYVVDVPTVEHPAGETSEWWFRDGAAQAAERGAMGGHAKNVIVFLGDGMSIATVTAARILEGQRNGHPGEENRLAWEGFPATALSKTYNTDSQTPDSAGTMSAIATGVKTRIGVLSVGPDVPRGDCTRALASPTTTLWELAASAGMDAGIVTTTRVTHATPAAAFSHVPERGWETDTDIPAAARAAGCIDIARQMVESPLAPRLTVLMGGGRTNFFATTEADPEYPAQHGRRADGRDLIAEWKQAHPRGAYVWNEKQLQQAPANAPLLALFEPSHMHYEHDRPSDTGGEPDLATMTRAAIARLSQNRNGSVLLVEDSLMRVSGVGVHRSATN